MNKYTSACVLKCKEHDISLERYWNVSRLVDKISPNLKYIYRYR